MTRFGRSPSRSEDTQRSSAPGIVPFVLSLEPIMGASAVIVIRLAPVRHAIGGSTAPIALVMPAIAALRGRIASIMDCRARLMGTRGPVMVRTGRVLPRIASRQVPIRAQHGRIASFMSATLSNVRGTVSVIPRTMLVT
jgi:hypothetical protein